MVGCNCNQQENALLSWVQGNDVLLDVRLYEKTISGTSVVEQPFDLTLCDEVKVKWQSESGIVGSPEHGINQVASNSLMIHLPRTLQKGMYSLEIIALRGGMQVRSFDMTFRVVRANSQAHSTPTTIGSQSTGSLRVTFQMVPQAFVRGQNSYEAWKELPGNEDKTLQEYIDEVLDLNAITAAAREATDAANNAAASAASTEADIETAEAARVTAEAGRVANENTRTVNEEAREGREVVRENNESGRVQSESTRVQSEFNRVQAERGRVAAETNREEAEAQRESDCAAAVSAANAAATNANNKAAVADSAASNANTKAALADEKATEAGRVNATVRGTTLTVTDRNGQSVSVDTKGEKGDDGGLLYPSIDFDPETGVLTISGDEIETGRISYDEEKAQLVITV